MEQKKLHYEKMSKVFICNQPFFYSQCNSEVSPNNLSVNFNYQKS